MVNKEHVGPRLTWVSGSSPSSQTSLSSSSRSNVNFCNSGGVGLAASGYSLESSEWTSRGSRRKSGG